MSLEHASIRLALAEGQTKVPDNSWSEHNEIIGNLSKNGICVKHVLCERVLKMHVALVLASSLTSGGSLSEPPSLVNRRQ